MIINERILRLIVTLSEELHFGRAAAALHLSQPALSGTLKSLERDLRVRIFHRTSRNVELTEAGRVLVAEARRLIQESERAVSLVRGCSPEVLGPLRIGYPATMNIHWMAALVAHARNGFPAPGVEFVSSEAAGLRDELAKRTLQAAFFAGAPRDPDFHSVKLFREDFCAVAASNRPLDRYAPLELFRLRDEPVVWLCREADPFLYDSFMDLCAVQGYRPMIAQQVRTFGECLQFAREGLGITFLPYSMMPARGDDSVKFISMAQGALHVQYTLAWIKSSGADRVDRFIKFAQERVPGKSPRSPAAAAC